MTAQVPMQVRPLYHEQVALDEGQVRAATCEKRLYATSRRSAARKAATNLRRLLGVKYLS